MYPAKKMPGHLKYKNGMDMYNYANNCQAWSGTSLGQSALDQSYYQFCANAGVYEITSASATSITYQSLTITYPSQSLYANWQQLGGHQTASGMWASQWQVVGTVSPEQIAAKAAAKAEAEAAASRADLLLMSFLSDTQADQYKKDSRFDLVINGRTYRINKGRSGNIQLIENGKPVAKYCAHPEIWTPDGDTMLAQMLMLKTDEAGFLQIANRTALA